MIQAIAPQLTPMTAIPSPAAALQSAEGPEAGFASLLGGSLREVNRLLRDSDQQASKVAVGKSENLHDAMISMEKAETAFKLLAQVRSKIIEAYHEVMRMQV